MNAAQQNRRVFSRILCSGHVEISSEDEKQQGKLLDLSLKGALVETSSDWMPAQGSPYHLQVTLQDAEAPMQMECSLAHIQGRLFGFTCRYIDLDSISYLRRLVELNLGNHELLERELTALG